MLVFITFDVLESKSGALVTEIFETFIKSMVQNQMLCSHRSDAALFLQRLRL